MSNQQTIPMNDLGCASGDLQSIIDAVSSVVRSGWFINGPRNLEFGKAFSACVNSKHFIGVGNGTDALQLALLALASRAGKLNHIHDTEVVTVANAGGYTSTACFSVGCVPVYCDVNEDDQLLCADSAVAALTEKTICVVATHLYGGGVDVPKLRAKMDDAGFRHVAILEDCAQAHGLHTPTGPAGSQADIATFSFYPTKNLGGMGDGGAVVTNDEELKRLVEQFRQYGWSSKYHISAPCGINSRLDEIQAAILTVRLGKLDEDNAKRSAIHDAYAAALPPEIKIVKSKIGNVAHLAVIKTAWRNELLSHMSKNNIATDIHYPILDPRQPGWQQANFRIGPSGLKVSEKSVGEIVSIPCFAQMNGEQIRRVCDALTSFRASTR